MAKRGKNETPAAEYKTERRRLMEEGPRRLYLLRGPEEYLRNYFLADIKAKCLPEGEDSFSYKRLNGPELSWKELGEALDAVPFLSERSLVEIREADVNRASEPDKLLKLLQDIPDYCTVVFVFAPDYELDKRLKLVKGLLTEGYDLYFDEQQHDQLVKWVAKRFAALGKRVEMEAAQELIFTSGSLMNRLIPEIDKIAAYAPGELVTVADVRAVANRIPEAVVFTMTDQIGERNFDRALETLSDLLSDKDNDPILLLSILGTQMRRLYAAALASREGLGRKETMELCSLRYDFLLTKLLASARRFTLRQLRRAVELCAETDYRMKSGGGDGAELLKEAVLRIAAGEESA